MQNLRGIIETRYYYTPLGVHVHSGRDLLGTHATRYLSAHGYTGSAIQTIIEAWNASTSEHNFALRLSEYGLALAEGQYLWHLIQLQ